MRRWNWPWIAAIAFALAGDVLIVLLVRCAWRHFVG